MGQRAWAPSPYSLPRPRPFLLLLILLLVPPGAQPQAGRVSTNPLLHSVAEGSLGCREGVRSWAQCGGLVR